jgi:hypothetical protein
VTIETLVGGNLIMKLPKQNNGVDLEYWRYNQSSIALKTLRATQYPPLMSMIETDWCESSCIKENPRGSQEFRSCLKKCRELFG